MGTDETWVFDEEELRLYTPSRSDGISYEEELSTLNRHVEKMQEGAVLLRLIGFPAYVAIILFRRYFLVESLKGSDVEAIAAASLFVSGKVCEYLRACKDIIYCCRKVYTKDSADFPDGEEITEDNVHFFDEKIRLLTAERDVLRVLNFDLNVVLPHDKIKEMITELFGAGTTGRHVHQASINFLVESMGNETHITHSSTEIAAACIIIGSAYSHVDLSEASTYDKHASRIRKLYDAYSLDPKRVQRAVQMVGIEAQRLRIQKHYGIDISSGMSDADEKLK
ncbi:hypothetical protein NDN08_006726 [Rhodosorus marinus]|uniref:Cyclin N-terminal domain-containing protein n=1 Tax=Rhodosorus marinus TaxID=101924 RepID=A0AAV8UJX2_9RHOD|nr:hypothetical protein NDN08_006726 [Rhodosorus marinus]